MIQPAVWMVWLSEVAASHLDNSLSAAFILGSLILWRERVGQLLPARQHHLAQIAAGLAVTQWRILEDRVIAHLQRALGPAGPGQHAGARDLEDPAPGVLAVLGVTHDDEGDMRVGPVDLLDR